MAAEQPIQTALLSVYNKTPLGPLVDELASRNVQMYASGGTAQFIESRGYEVAKVEDLTDFPAILGGRVKTLHPAVFGGILAKRGDPQHETDITAHSLPQFDMVVVDLYPFEATLAETSDAAELVEKIDIGGIALIRAAAKNFQHVWCVPSSEHFEAAIALLQQSGAIPAGERRAFARQAFAISSRYDELIGIWLGGGELTPLRYGENPHQAARFEGNLDENLQKISGKPLSYNNLLDVDGALRLTDDLPAEGLAIFKHSNPCGIALGETAEAAWDAALACDPVSAFGGIVITGHTIDEAAAAKIHEHFYEILIAPAFTPAALELLKQKEKRILMKLRSTDLPAQTRRSVAGGTLIQQADRGLTAMADYDVVTDAQPGEGQLKSCSFAEMAVKHLKSNAICIVNDRQMIGAGVGQTSRIDALNQAIEKARRFGFDLQGAVLASDGFFPFADGVETAHQAGITTIVQPGGSRRDQDSIDYCNANGVAMIFTNNRHFRH